MTSMQVHADIK